MNFLRKVLSRFRAASPKTPPIPPDWQELRITTVLAPPDDVALARLLEDVKAAVAVANAGQFDEYEELGNAQICIYLLGPSTDRLLEAVIPALQRHGWTAGAEIYRAYGSTMDQRTVEVITRFSVEQPGVRYSN